MPRTRASLGRWVGGAVVLILLGAGLAAAFWPQPVPVDVVTVARGPLTVTVDGEGETRVKDVYVVAAPVSGRLMRITADVGDRVVGGETVIATVVPTDPAFLDVRSRARAESDVQRAEAALALAQAELNRARAELDRVSRLVDRGNVSLSRYDQAVMEVRTREAEVASREAEIGVRRSELEAARAALIQPGGDDGVEGGEGSCCVQVRSPHDGVILRILRESEGVVAAGEPLVEVGDTGELEVVVDLLSTDAVQVRPGDEVLIEDWGGGGDALHGAVRRVEPFAFTKVSALGIDEQRANVLIDLTSPSEAWAALGHGYRVMTRIVVWRGADVVGVPIGAVFRPTAAGRPDAAAPEDWAVFVVDADGRARLRQVTLGRFTDRAVEVTGGLEPGEAVVLHPSDRIEDGTRVVRRADGIG